MRCRQCKREVKRKGTRGPIPQFCDMRCRSRFHAAKPRSEVTPLARPRRPPTTVPIVVRLERHVEVAGEHWLWTGARGHSGRPVIGIGQRPRSVRAVMWTLFHGPVPDGQQVRTTCDVPLCVHPEHLRVVPRRPAGSRRRPPLPPGLAQLAADYRLILLADPCSYCGAPADTVDHITAVARGGSDEWDNLTAACGPCNNAKFTKPLLRALREGVV